MLDGLVEKNTWNHQNPKGIYLKRYKWQKCRLHVEEAQTTDVFSIFAWLFAG